MMQQNPYKRVKHHCLCLAAAMLMVGMTAGTTTADLIAEDQFIIGSGDYTASTNVVGQSSASSTGFDGSWQFVNSGIFKPETAGLSYGDGANIVGQLATAGGSLQIDTAPHNDTFREVLHDLSPFATANTYYYAALMSVPSDPDGEAYLQLQESGGLASEVGFGFDSEQAVVRLRGTSTAAPLTAFVPDEPTLFVMRIDVDTSGSNDTVSLWVNPTQYSSQAAAGPAKLTINTEDIWDNSAPVDRLSPSNRDLGGAGITAFDEVRLATRWEDAVPLSDPSQRHLGFQEDVLPTGSYMHHGSEMRERSGATFGTDSNIRVGNLDNNAGVGDMRTALGFDISTISDKSVIEEVTLRLTVDSLGGSGLIGDLNLHAILPGDSGENMIEGQTNWANRQSGDPWTTPGGDFDSTVLSSISIGNVTNLSAGDVVVFESTAALVALVQDALDNGDPLELLIIAPDAEAGTTNSFIRWRSDDFGSSTQDLISRPLLSVSYVPTPAALPAGLLLLGTLAARRHRR